VNEELGEQLGSNVTALRQLAGGASKEAWAVELEDGRELLVRRAGVGVIHRDTLTLEQEFHVLEAAVHHDDFLRRRFHPGPLRRLNCQRRPRPAGR